MKRVLFIAISILAVCFATVTVQASDSITSVSMACHNAGVQNCSYGNRYNMIDKIYYATGIVLFDKESNPYTRNMVNYAEPNPPRYYIGTAEQNAKLARNILKNRNFFSDGKLSDTEAKQWSVVD